jgi:hypothetical protein
MPDISLFLSHSAADAELARLLVNMAEKALALPARSIRCSSVDGYRLPGGRDTDEMLRDEIAGAQAFVALLTPHSLDSTYVLFEVGARWGARKHFFPVIACGATAKMIEGPMAGLNILNAASPPQLYQLLEELRDVLGLSGLQPIAAFSGAVDGVSVAAAKVRSPDGEVVRSVSIAALTDDEVVALLQEWMGRRTARENLAPIYYADVETQLGVPKSRLTRLLEIAAAKYNYVPDRKGDTLILFKQLASRGARAAGT